MPSIISQQSCQSLSERPLVVQLSAKFEFCLEFFPKRLAIHSKFMGEVMDVNYSKLLLKEVSERLVRSPEDENTGTWAPIDHIEVKKLLLGEADGG